VPGRTPAEAVEVFLEPIRESLSCLCRAKLTLSAGGRGAVGQTHLLTLNGGRPVVLGGGLTLDARIHYEIIRMPDARSQPFRITTRAYLHTIANDAGAELISAHWHPTGNSARRDPDWHVGSAALAEDGVFTPRAHIPSPRVSFEAVVRLAIDQFDVKPTREDWSEVIERCEQSFVSHRTWE
jgi:hypothetical protein